MEIVKEKKKRKQADRVIKYFAQQELKKIFNVIIKSENQTDVVDRHWLRNIAMFRLAYRCALRASELGTIMVYDVNWLRREVYCRRLKGSNNNTIRLDDETYKWLKKYIKEYELSDNDNLFMSQEKGPITRQMLDKLTKRYCAAAKIADVSKHHFHTLKHSIALHLSESGVDIKDLQYWMGHANINNTLEYFKYTTVQQNDLYIRLEKNNRLV